MGERQNGPFQLSFNSSLKVDFQGSRITSDGGLILVRELDEHLGFGDLVAQHLTNSRRGKNTQLPLADLLRQSVYSRIVGYVANTIQNRGNRGHWGFRERQNATFCGRWRQPEVQIGLSSCVRRESDISYRPGPEIDNGNPGSPRLEENLSIDFSQSTAGRWCMSKATIASFLAGLARKHLVFAESVARQTFGDKLVLLDYPVTPSQRWNDSNLHQELYSIINRNRTNYINRLKSFLAFTENFVKIPQRQSTASCPSEPSWINSWMPALDGVALYGLVAMKQPKHFLEVGSGNSTKFARKAITDHRLNTKIISIDPHPRAEIDMLCDQVVREPLEAISLDIFDRLESGDILYVDNSHRVFMNSDATVIFLDVIPKLKPGVLVEIHDVFLPYDYPQAYIGRHYSEQYLLAAYLLAKGQRFDIVLPNTFITRDNELRTILMPLWQRAEMQNVETHGCSFWIQMN